MFFYLVEKISFENGGESSGNYRNPELKQRRSGVSTVRPAFRLDAVVLVLQKSCQKQFSQLYHRSYSQFMCLKRFCGHGHVDDTFYV